MTHLLRTLPLAVLGALALASCSTTAYVEIRHPLQVGQVDPNSVPFEARGAERERGLPAGALVDQAQLTELTPDRICVQTNIWSLQSRQERGLYANYRIVMLNDQSGVENTQGEVIEQTRQVTPMQGTVAERRQTGWRNVCAARNSRGGCVRYTRQAVYQTFYVPHVWNVISNPAQVCFANGGFVTPATGRVGLEFRPIGGAGSFTFEWQFANTVAGGQQ